MYASASEVEIDYSTFKQWVRRDMVDYVQMENGKYTIEIMHGHAFSSVLSGLDFAYSLVGDTVYGNIPVGYLKGGEMSMCFCKNDGSMIVDYQIVDGTILWVV